MWATAMLVGLALGLLVLPGSLSSATAAVATNDSFVSAQALAAGGGTVSGDSTGATKEVGEPNHAGNDGGASVWFAWTPSFSGYAVIETAGTSFDGLVAAYTGSSVGQLALVASNDDMSEAASSARICFQVTAGLTWHVALDGFAGASGPWTLSFGAKTDASPCPTLPPVVSGPAAPKVGDQLMVSDGSFADSGGTASRQWLRCSALLCNSLDGATGSTYTLSSRDVGLAIRVDVANSDGTTEVRNTSSPTAVVGLVPTLAPNGRIFSSASAGGGGWDLFSRFGDGSGLNQVTSQPSAIMPAASPDGRLLAFVEASTSSISVSYADGYGRSPVAQGVYPSWSPDGTRLAFVSGPFLATTLETFDLVTGQRDTLRTFDAEEIWDSAWSPDGTKIAFTYADRTSPTPNSDIAVIAADGTGPIQVLSTSTVNEQNVAWSPTGTQLSYTRGVTAGNSVGDADLWVMNADGSNDRRLVDADSDHPIWTSAWSPDGTTIVYSQFDNQLGESGLFVVPATGGEPVRLPRLGPADVGPTWAPAADYILSVATEGTGTGTVMSTPAGIACGGTCSAEFSDPTVVTLTPVPAAGSTFTGWADDCSGVGSCTIPMLGDRLVTATFAAAAPSSGGGGGGGGTVPSDVALTMSADRTTARIGDTILYRIEARIANQSGGMTKLQVTDTLPGNLELVSTRASRGPGCQGTRTVVCDMDFLFGTVVATLELAARVTGPGEIVNTAVARPNVLDPNQANNTAVLRIDAFVDTTVTLPSQGARTAAKGTTKGARKTGNAHANLLRGTEFADVLRGMGGNDTLLGLGGDDYLAGGPGRDTIRAGAGNDRISARDRRRDTITCGPGRDIVTADRIDTVTRDCERVSRP